MTQEGIVFNIQRYTVHDGPGIRTELFLKGCPLSCRWCGNPESQSAAIEPGVYAIKCIGEENAAAAKRYAHREKPDFRKPGGAGGEKSGEPKVESADAGRRDKLVSIDRKQCTNCMKCADICPADAIKAWGKKMTAEEAMAVIRKDADYYRSSRGGVTVSGGEPLMQSDFVAELFRQCRAENIHTCLESTFCTDWSIIEKVLPETDLLITDIKHMDSEIHREHTGVSNEKILENIRRISRTGKELIIRIPVIPGVSDGEENAAATADFILNELGNRIKHLQLLGFMRLGEEKYASLGIPYPMRDIHLDRDKFNQKIKDMAKYFNDRGIRCIAGTAGEKDGGTKK